MADKHAAIIKEISAELSASERKEVDAFFANGTVARSIPAMLAIMAITTLIAG